MNNISRRTIAKGTAWAIPAVTITAAAPAMAASTPCDPATNIKNITVMYSTQNDEEGGVLTNTLTQTFTAVEGTLPKGTQIIVNYTVAYPSGTKYDLSSTNASNVTISHTSAPLDAENTVDKYTQTMTLDKPLEAGQSVSMFLRYAFPEDTEGYVTATENRYPYPDQTIVGECETTIVSFKEIGDDEDSE